MKKKFILGLVLVSTMAFFLWGCGSVDLQNGQKAPDETDAKSTASGLAIDSEYIDMYVSIIGKTSGEVETVLGEGVLDDRLYYPASGDLVYFLYPGCFGSDKGNVWVRYVNDFVRNNPGEPIGSLV